MVDYSKWKDIEISDDEDDTHPNIDTPSLFRWRHQARLDRMEEKDKEKLELAQEKKKYDDRVSAVKAQIAAAEALTDVQERKEKKLKAEKQLKELQKDMQKVQLKHKEFEKKEKMEPWNVDTISKEGFDKSLINKEDSSKRSNMTEEEKEEDMRQFVKKNEKLIKQYGCFRHYEDSMRFMTENNHLACENTANYLVIHCINLQLEGKNELMRHVAHQAICLQFILELASQLDRDPRACVSAFFRRIQQTEAEYQRVFQDELSSFIARIERRAKEKIAEAEKEAEEEEKEARLGPGGLDPLEVLETLPEGLKACFESQDVSQLKNVIAAMEPDAAALHMKRCVASGLWVPEGGLPIAEGLEAPPTDLNTGLLDKGDNSESEEDNKSQPIYEKVEDSVD